MKVYILTEVLHAPDPIYSMSDNPQVVLTFDTDAHLISKVLNLRKSVSCDPG